MGVRVQSCCIIVSAEKMNIKKKSNNKVKKRESNKVKRKRKQYKVISP